MNICKNYILGCPNDQEFKAGLMTRHFRHRSLQVAVFSVGQRTSCLHGCKLQNIVHVQEPINTLKEIKKTKQKHIRSPLILNNAAGFEGISFVGFGFPLTYAHNKINGGLIGIIVT